MPGSGRLGPAWAWARRGRSCSRPCRSRRPRRRPPGCGRARPRYRPNRHRTARRRSSLTKRRVKGVSTGRGAEMSMRDDQPVGRGRGKVGLEAALFRFGPGDGGDRHPVRRRSRSSSAAASAAPSGRSPPPPPSPAGAGNRPRFQHVGDACARGDRRHLVGQRRFAVDRWEQGRSAKCRHRCAAVRPKSAAPRWRWAGVTSIRSRMRPESTRLAGQVHRAEPQRLVRGGAGQADLQARRSRPAPRSALRGVIRLFDGAAAVALFDHAPTAQKAASTDKPGGGKTKAAGAIEARREGAWGGAA